ncbi:hypothetical protein MMC13_005795 [Lambiella insularis]|nr:hypothetical protein [Lambiella insularis]
MATQASPMNTSAEAKKNDFTRALESNRKWARQCAQDHPDLFPTLAKGQHPSILWIGCSDSRAPETTLLGLKPGDVFVHRNIANILHPGDISAGSVIEYAVAHVGVKHVVVCGHTSCGGVNAALGNQKVGLVDTWLLPLRSLRAQLAHKLAGLSQAEKVQVVVEANVLAGVRTVQENPNVIEAVKSRGLTVHGLVYDVGSGALKELKTGHLDQDTVEAFQTFAGGQ